MKARLEKSILANSPSYLKEMSRLYPDRNTKGFPLDFAETILRQLSSVNF